MAGSYKGDEPSLEGWTTDEARRSRCAFVLVLTMPPLISPGCFDNMGPDVVGAQTRRLRGRGGAIAPKTSKSDSARHGIPSHHRLHRQGRCMPVRAVRRAFLLRWLLCAVHLLSLYLFHPPSFPNHASTATSPATSSGSFSGSGSLGRLSYFISSQLSFPRGWSFVCFVERENSPPQR